MATRPGSWRERYLAHLRSPVWALKRKTAINHAGHMCERCYIREEEAGGLDVHHLTYARLGKESPCDLIVLCRRCHETEDEKRAEEGRKKSQEALWNARVDGWATKKYGEDWEQSLDYHDVEDEFEEWLENLGEDS